MAMARNPRMQLTTAVVVESQQDQDQQTSPETTRSSSPISFSEEHAPSSRRSLPTKVFDSFKEFLGPSAWTLQRFRFISVNVAIAVVGMHDSSAGALIPYIQSHYDLTYMIVSLLFVSQSVAYIIAAFANTYLTDKLGMAKVLALGAICQILGYIMLSLSPHFAVFCIGYGISGLGIAFQDAQANVYTANLPNSSNKLGLMHFSFGVGAFAAPLVATSMASHGIKFSYYYAIMIGVIVIDLSCILGAFKLRSDSLGSEHAPSETRVRTSEMGDVELTQSTGTTHNNSSSPSSQHPVEMSSTDKVKQVLSSRTSVVAGLFLVLYAGCEVSMGGWIVSFLMDHRQGDASSGYVSSGFFGGMALGRIALLKVNYWVGERNASWLYLLSGIGLEFIVWFVPNLIANAFAASMVGFVLGPLYPIVISIMTKILPRSLHAASVGFVAALSQTGGAIFPFITGSLAQDIGVVVLHPVMLILMGLMCILWILMPKVSRRSE